MKTNKAVKLGVCATLLALTLAVAGAQPAQATTIVSQDLLDLMERIDHGELLVPGEPGGIIGPGCTFPDRGDRDLDDSARGEVPDWSDGPQPEPISIPDWEQ